MNLDNAMETTLEGQWVVDSESGIEYLMDLKTGQKLAIKIDGKWLNPEAKPQ